MSVTSELKLKPNRFPIRKENLENVIKLKQHLNVDSLLRMYCSFGLESNKILNLLRPYWFACQIYEHKRQTSVPVIAETFMDSVVHIIRKCQNPIPTINGSNKTSDMKW